MGKGSRKAVIAALFGNLGVAIFKLIAGFIGNSSSMLAESLHSFSDTFNQIFLLVGIKKSKKEPERVYIYVMPNEVEFFDAESLSKRVGKEIFVYAVNDKDKHDPEGKSKKAKPGKPGIYVE